MVNKNYLHFSKSVIRNTAGVKHLFKEYSATTQSPADTSLDRQKYTVISSCKMKG